MSRSGSASSPARLAGRSSWPRLWATQAWPYGYRPGFWIVLVGSYIPPYGIDRARHPGEPPRGADSYRLRTLARVSKAILTVLWNRQSKTERPLLRSWA